MGHSYVHSLYHCVFSTKERKRLITDELQLRLWPYIGGIARENDCKAIAVGGVEDHAHVLLSLPSTMAISKAIQLIKGGSSKWIHEEFPSLRNFAWQEGYGAFSIGISQLENTVRYIANQRDHHCRVSFKMSSSHSCSDMGLNTIRATFGDKQESRLRSSLRDFRFRREHETQR